MEGEIRLKRRAVEVAVRAGWCSEQGRRPSQEDTHVLFLQEEEASTSAASFQAVAVFDGHGGTRASQFCSANLVKTLREEMAQEEKQEDEEEEDKKQEKAQRYERWLTRALERLEREYLALSREADLADGCTAVIAVLRSGLLLVANVGDSEAVLVTRARADKAQIHDTILMTELHSPKNPSESTRCRQAGGTLFGDRLCHPVFPPQIMSIAVSRSIGDLIFKDEEFCRGSPVALISTPHVSSRCLDPASDWFLVLACDGVFDVMTKNEVASVVADALRSEPTDVNGAARSVVNRALELFSTDNCSCIVVTLSN